MYIIKYRIFFIFIFFQITAHAAFDGGKKQNESNLCASGPQANQLNSLQNESSKEYKEKLNFVQQHPVGAKTIENWSIYVQSISFLSAAFFFLMSRDNDQDMAKMFAAFFAGATAVNVGITSSYQEPYITILGCPYYYKRKSEENSKNK